MASSSPKFSGKTSGLFRLILWILILIGVATGIRSASFRWNREQDNRRIEIAVDFAELRTLAAAEGVPIAEVLKQFRAAGATSVALQEETIGGLEEARRISVKAEGSSQTQLWPLPGLLSSTAKIEQIDAALRAKTRFVLEDTARGLDAHLSISEPWNTIRGVGIGFDPETVSSVHDAGLGVVGRVNNWTGVTPQGLTWTLDDLKKQGVSTILFSGDEVLGYKGYVVADPKHPEQETTDTVLRKDDLYYGALEFGKQKGDPQLAKAAPDRVVRVHTIPGAEMLSATVPEAVQRFSLAARERNIRLIFVRLFLDEPNPLRFNTDYVGKIVIALERGKLHTGTAHGYGPLRVGMIPRLLMGFGIGAAFLLLVDAITNLLSGGVGWSTGLFSALGSIAIVGLVASPVAMGVKLAALAAALIFPSLGLLRSDLLDKDTPASALGKFLFASLITAFGIANVIGLLADRSFLVKSDAFVGIKATLAIPLLLVALVYALDLRARPDRTFAKAIRDMVDRLIEVSRQPILIWQIVAGIIALVFVFVILSRSGNESGVGVSGFELKIRALLDKYLVARPRFKDMFGHTAMVLSLLLFARTRRRDWALPLFLLGVFGQVSLLNTFCHLHTPIAVSLWRAGLGIGIGLIGGYFGYWLLDRALLRHVNRPSGAQDASRSQGVTS